MVDPYVDDVIIDAEEGEVGRHLLRVQRRSGKTTIVCRTCKQTILELVGATRAQVEAAVENHA